MPDRDDREDDVEANNDIDPNASAAAAAAAAAAAPPPPPWASLPPDLLALALASPTLGLRDVASAAAACASWRAALASAAGTRAWRAAGATELGPSLAARLSTAALRAELAEELARPSGEAVLGGLEARMASLRCARTAL